MTQLSALSRTTRVLPRGIDIVCPLLASLTVTVVGPGLVAVLEGAVAGLVVGEGLTALGNGPFDAQQGMTVVAE